MQAKELNDSLDNLFDGDKTADGAARVQPPAAYVELKAAGHFEKCQKCRGAGRVRWGTCFACQGAGGKTFKTSAGDRANARNKAVERKAVKQRTAVDDFKAAEPAVFAWLLESQDRFPFAASLMEKLHRYGDLTDGQLDACRKSIAKRDAARAARAAVTAAAPVADTAGVDRLKASFDKAIAYAASKGLKKSPKITIGSVVISPAKATSKNPGALYVTESREYLGKIVGGQFFAVRECSEAQKANVLKLIADPQAASEVYGRETGTCCICNATLTSEWKKRGIGPICAEKFGW